MDGGVLLTQPGHDLQSFRGLHHLVLRRGRFVAAGPYWSRFRQAGAMGVDRLLDRLAEVGPQVIAISDLFGLRRADPSALPVTAGTVPADDLHLGVIAEPGSQVLPVAAVVEVQRPVGGHVDQYRAVVAAPAEGEVVDAEDLHLADLRLGQGPDQPQQCVPTYGEADRGRQSGSCPAGQGQPDLRQHLAQQRSMPTVRGGQSRDLFGERHRSAGRVFATEAAHA